MQRNIKYVKTRSKKKRIFALFPIQLNFFIITCFPFITKQSKLTQIGEII
uniref:Uncharacterized protein n=1 Tax=Rhizophora mucronata TaxID=61149 RepID=A0A2P2PV00_RHIMU